MLGRLRINGNPEEKGLSICLIKSFRASTKRGIRAIILACRNLDSATRMFVNHLLAVSISALRRIRCFSFISFVLSLACPGTASLHSTGIIAKPQGHSFSLNPLRQVRSCVAWFRAGTRGNYARTDVEALLRFTYANREHCV